MSKPDGVLVLLRRELVRAQAGLKRAERERDDLREENARLRRERADRGPGNGT